MKISIDVKKDSISISIGRTSGTHQRKEEGGWVLPAAESDRLNCALAKAADIGDGEAEDILDDLFVSLMEISDALELA